MIRTLVTFAALAAVIVVYLKFIRPTLASLPHLKSMYAHADGFWANFWAKLRAWWDLIVSGSLIVLPQLPDLLSQLAPQLEILSPSDATKMVTAIFGIVSIVIRAVTLRQTAS